MMPLTHEWLPQALQPTSEDVELARDNSADAAAEAVARLAQLSPAAYEQVRKAEAQRLGLRVGMLDKWVADCRAARGSSSTINLRDYDPWPEQVDGAEVLNQTAETLARYVVLPAGAADAIALWVAGTHCFDAFPCFPRLHLGSPERGCGKTTLLDVLATLVPRPQRTENATPAALFRLIELAHPTLLLDEVDTYLPNNDDLRGLLNAGHARGGTFLRTEGDRHDVRSFNCFAPVALAGIGHLPGTLHDRSIVVRLVRAKPGEIAARFDSRRTEAETVIARKLARWTADHRAAIETSDPPLPPNAFNRLADNWRPLFTLAEIAGNGWSERAARAFHLLTNTDMDTQGLGTRLLTDIREVFSQANTDRMSSAQLAEALAAMEGRPWAEFGKRCQPITPNQLANQLRKFGVSPRVLRIGDETPRGYLLDDFREVFERFLPPPCDCSSTSPLPEKPC